MVGFGMVSDWYRNIIANPKVEIWLTNVRCNLLAGGLDLLKKSQTKKNILPIIRQLIIASAFTRRLAGINPNMPDEELDKITSEYQLFQIMPTEPHTVTGGG
jgi:hypothetical protein